MSGPKEAGLNSREALPDAPKQEQASRSPSGPRGIGACWLHALLLGALLLTSNPGRAALYAIPGTEVRVLPRSASGRDYTLYVGLPASYVTSPTRKYPVIYACDGYWDFPLLMAEVSNLTYDQAMPECIVVGLAYSGVSPDVGLLRQWDLTPGVDSWADPSGTASGHAQDFLTAIADQIIPFVEAQYRVDKTYRVLTGSSYAGLFTVYALFERPGLFQGYVAPSPSLWWRSRAVITTATNYLATHNTLNARLYLSWGAEESSSIQDSTKLLYANLKAATATGFSVTAREAVGERHAGPKGEAMNRGLRYVFAPIAPLPSTASDPGFVLKSNFINVSTRGYVGAGEAALIAGIAVRGLEAKRVLVRAIGPTLKTLGVESPLSNPRLKVVNEAHEVVASIDDWGDAPSPTALITASLRAGAFQLPTGSKDAALLVTLPPGLYTVVVESTDANTGVALVEVYETGS